MTPEGEIYGWHRYVPGICSDEDLAALRALFAGYTEAGIARHLSSLEADCTPATLPQSPLGGLIGLFHEGFYVSEEELPADVVGLLERLGLIAPAPQLPGFVYGTVAIPRVAGELIVCDRPAAPDGSDESPPPDLVYPPVFDTTLRYLASLPSTPCDAMLELGTGAGIAAIMGARHARRVWATDIATRAVQFTSLSCRLAGLDNVTVLEGDLYHPVEGLTFDRIAFHPPWIPAAQSSFIFGDGGADGETIIRGAIEELPRFLRPGGRFHATLLASDREGERFEQRVRRWLGAAQDQFDVAVAELSCASPDEFLAQNLGRGSIAESEVPLWSELWRATRTQAVLYAHLIVQRHQSEREPATARGPSWVPNRLSTPA